MEWRPAGWSVCLPLLIFPCTVKCRSSPLAPAHPGGPRKLAVKRLWCGGGVMVRDAWCWLSQVIIIFTASAVTTLWWYRNECIIIMAAQCNRGAIIFLPCGFFLSSIYLSFFFPRLISAATDRMSTILLHMVWPYCEFRMQV